MPFIPSLKVQDLSKREASQFRPSDRALLISIQDGDKAHLPFKQRTNHITRDRYVATLFCYFDDVQTVSGLNYPFAINTNDAKQTINFLNQKGKVHGGNHYVYNLLEETLANQKS